MSIRHGTDTVARSRNHCCSGKTISITKWESAFAAILTHHAARMRRNILSLWPVWLYNNVFHIISKTARLSGGKKAYLTQDVCFDLTELLS